MSLNPGTCFGHYEVAALIGVGGMGEVYRATDTQLKRDVALKVLPESFVTDPNRLARLQREAEMLASLNHANVAQIHGLERSDGRTAIVMELVEGASLADRIAQGALPPNEALNLALQIAAALEAAHERGIVHRDLKPANIKLKPDGTVKVLDFGIAKALDARAISGPPSLTTPSMTEAGVVLGTAGYMSPEQARGKPVDKRADVWAFGCVLYEMLTGKAAFAGDDMTTTLARVLEREPDMRQLPSGLSPSVRSTLELCLQKDAKKRLNHIGDVRLALEGEIASGSAVRAGQRPLWRRALPVAAALVIGALVAGVYVASTLRPTPPAEQLAALPITRFVVTPPANAPLASVGGYDVVVSPDGKRIAYYAQNPENGSVGLYARELDALEARPIAGTEIAQPPANGNMNPFFSADGKSIGFFAPDRGIMRVAIDGGPPLKMLDAPDPAFLGATWAADDTLIYSTGQHLERVSAGGGGVPEPLTDETGTAIVTSPVLLPGGRAVMFTMVDNAVERVAVVDLDKKETKVIVEGGANAFYSDTGHVVFARGSTVMAAPFNVAELAVTGEPVALLGDVRHPNTQTAADYAVSASGTLVYVPGGAEGGARAEVVWVDRAGRAVGRAIAEPVENPRDPALSPDGTRLLLSTGLLNDGDLWSYDLRGRPPIRLAVVGDDRNPVWSPDGSEVVLTVIEGGIMANLQRMRADGSMLAPQPLRPERIQGVVRAWSSAGELFIVRPPLRTADIAVLPAAATGEMRDLVVTEYQEADPALSPGGHWLAYASNRTGRPEIWVQGYPDGVAVRVSSNGGFEPRWSADGRELFYLQGTAMMAVAVQTSGEFSFDAPVQLFNGQYLAVLAPAVSSYDVAPDGRFLMIQPAGTGGENARASIVVVQNWTEELKRRVPGK